MKINKKIIYAAGILALSLICSATVAYADEFDPFSDEALFGSEEDLFGTADDDEELFFADDVIEEVTINSSENKELNHGTLFQAGSIKIGGKFDLGLTSYTTLYEKDKDISFGDRIAQTRLSPSANAQITIDARPTQTFRMYTKAGMNYPYTITASSTSSPVIVSDVPSFTTPTITTTITNSFYVKELFSDFSIQDKVFFRFGLHTVTWGAGYFFSPVSDIINTSSINPENTDEQVNGSLNLRAQIPFTGTQNCLWLYVIPDSTTNSDAKDFSDYLTAAQFPYMLNKTAVAAKADIVLANWEFGVGGFYKYQSAPKAMLTATGSIIHGKVSVFSEAVYSYGSASEWKTAPDSWENKTHIFQATAGLSYYWKDPQISFAAQYYYDGNSDDHNYSTKGHNIAGTISFGKTGIPDLTANIFGLFYIGKEPLSDIFSALKAYQSGSTINPYAGILSMSVTWTPINELKINAGPYVTWFDFEKDPSVAIKISVTLGSGKF